SPGVDEPLVHDWQFERSIGRLVEVHYLAGEETHTVHGRLQTADSKEIAIAPIHLDGKRNSIPDSVHLQKDEQPHLEPVAMVKIGGIKSYIGITHLAKTTPTEADYY